MIKNILNLTLLTLLNFLLLKRSSSIDVDQLFYDIEALGLSTYINRANVNFFNGISVSILTLSLIYFFKPFKIIWSPKPKCNKSPILFSLISSKFL